MSREVRVQTLLWERSNFDGRTFRKAPCQKINNFPRSPSLDAPFFRGSLDACSSVASVWCSQCNKHKLVWIRFNSLGIRKWFYVSGFVKCLMINTKDYVWLMYETRGKGWVLYCTSRAFLDRSCGFLNVVPSTSGCVQEGSPIHLLQTDDMVFHLDVWLYCMILRCGSVDLTGGVELLFALHMRVNHAVKALKLWKPPQVCKFVCDVWTDHDWHRALYAPNSIIVYRVSAKPDVSIEVLKSVFTGRPSWPFIVGKYDSIND